MSEDINSYKVTRTQKDTKAMLEFGGRTNHSVGEVIEQLGYSSSKLSKLASKHGINTEDIKELMENQMEVVKEHSYKIGNHEEVDSLKHILMGASLTDENVVKVMSNTMTDINHQTMDSLSYVTNIVSLSSDENKNRLATHIDSLQIGDPESDLDAKLQSNNETFMRQTAKNQDDLDINIASKEDEQITNKKMGTLKNFQEKHEPTTDLHAAERANIEPPLLAMFDERNIGKETQEDTNINDISPPDRTEKTLGVFQEKNDELPIINLPTVTAPEDGKTNPQAISSKTQPPKKIDTDTISAQPWAGDIGFWAGFNGGEEQERVATQQRNIKAAGYDIGDSGFDGKKGHDTDKAIKHIQRDYGVTDNGIINEETSRIISSAAESARALTFSPDRALAFKTLERPVFPLKAEKYQVEKLNISEILSKIENQKITAYSPNADDLEVGSIPTPNLPNEIKPPEVNMKQ